MPRLRKNSVGLRGTSGQAIRWMRACAVLLLSGALLAGCPKKPNVGQAGPGTVGPQAATTTQTPPGPSAKPIETPVSRPAAPREAAVPPQPGARGTGASSPAESPLKDIFFDFDKATMRDDQKAALAQDVTWLKAHPAARSIVEGHCDERGTAEYNLALGDRRAKAVRDALVAAGIQADRIRTVSYGKERPFLLGHDESAWKLNRRAQFVRE